MIIARKGKDTTKSVRMCGVGAEEDEELEKARLWLGAGVDKGD